MGVITSVLFAGVGGQGIILSSYILARTAFSQGLMVKESEVHGMAQRGGSVISHVRFGTEVHSPLIPKGMADYLVALEELEALRQQSFAKQGAIIILNRKQLAPITADPAKNPYPGDVHEKLAAAGFLVHPVDALAIAAELGAPKTENVVLVGALSSFLPFPPDAWEEIIAATVPGKTVDVNKAAFRKGRELTSLK